MNEDDLFKFVQANVEPLPAFSPYPERYRVSATLTDGTFLPCVVVEQRRPTVELALSRFKETEDSAHKFMDHRAVVSTFVTDGNRINSYDIDHLGLSEYAIPLARMKEIKGETSMSWTQFYGTMSDGKEFCFGTTYSSEFFNMPEGYRAAGIVKIKPAQRGARPRPDEVVYRERPYFACYVGKP